VRPIIESSIIGLFHHKMMIRAQAIHLILEHMQNLKT
jgi:hypothetical protein